MKSVIWLRCLIINIVLAIIAPLFSMNLEMPIDMTSLQNEIKDLNPEDIIQLTEEEFKEKVEPYLIQNKIYFERL